MGNKTTNIVLAGVAVLATGLAIGLLLNRSDNQGASDQALARILDRLEALEAGRIDSTPMNSGANGVSTAATAQQNALRTSGLASRNGKPAFSPEQVKARKQTRLRAFETRFAQEPRDAAAAQVEIDMLKAMDDKLLASTGTVAGNPDVECRRDSCRVTANFRSSDQAMEWALHYVTLLGGNMVTNAQPMTVSNPDGSVQMRMYATRGGS